MEGYDLGLRLKEAWYSTCKEENGLLIPITREDGSFYVEDNEFNKLHNIVRKSVDENKESIALEMCGCLRDTLEVITFKRMGNCFFNGGINFKIDGEVINRLSHSVTCIGGYVIDLLTGVNGVPISKYLEQLYELNSKCNLRIDYTLSQFDSYEDGDALTLEMCSYLRTKEGLPYKKFIELHEKAKKEFEERQKSGDKYE